MLWCSELNEILKTLMLDCTINNKIAPNILLQKKFKFNI